VVKLTYTSGTLSETRHFYYTANNQDIEERVGSSTAMDKQFVWGVRYIDELICRDDATPLRLYATQDANFNVTALVSTSGAVQQRFLYDPYGNSTVLSSTWTSTTDVYAWSRRFTGQFFDIETGLYYYRARYYHSTLGRFASRDAIGYGASSNLYEYAASQPPNKTDPFGFYPYPIVPCGALEIATAATECESFGGLVRAVCVDGGTITLPDGTVVRRIGVYAYCKDTGDCTPDRYVELRDAVHPWCDLDRSCAKIQCCTSDSAWDRVIDCGNIARFIFNGEMCVNARRTLMNTCFRGGDKRHQPPLNDAIAVLNSCKQKWQDCQCP
jgi:RHS repeat-associated protein